MCGTSYAQPLRLLKKPGRSFSEKNLHKDFINDIYFDHSTAISIITMSFSLIVFLSIGFFIAWKYFQDKHYTKANKLKDLFMARFIKVSKQFSIPVK